MFRTYVQAKLLALVLQKPSGCAREPVWPDGKTNLHKQHGHIRCTAN